jgi:choline dehydrogenase
MRRPVGAARRQSLARRGLVEGSACHFAAVYEREHPDDVRAMTSAMEFVRDLLDDPITKPFYGQLLQPGPRDDWETFAKTTLDSYHHGVGTCQMGPADNPMAVVDQTLRVHGLDNVWVADASIMPTVVHANTNLTAIMIGERAADFVKAAD